MVLKVYHRAALSYRGHWPPIIAFHSIYILKPNCTYLYTTLKIYMVKHTPDKSLLAFKLLWNSEYDDESQLPVRAHINGTVHIAGTMPCRTCAKQCSRDYLPFPHTTNPILKSNI